MPGTRPIVACAERRSISAMTAASEMAAMTPPRDAAARLQTFLSIHRAYSVPMNPTGAASEVLRGQRGT